MSLSHAWAWLLWKKMCRVTFVPAKVWPTCGFVQFHPSRPCKWRSSQHVAQWTVILWSHAISLRTPERSCVSICRMTEQNQPTAWLSHELQTLCWWLPDSCLSRSGHKRGDPQPRTEIRTLLNLPVSSLLSDCFCGSGGVTNNVLLSGFCSQWP